MSRIQRVELFLFIACFSAYAYFHQGGGWNQNARFAEVRAMVEEGRFAIDDYVVYETVPGSAVLRRNPLDHADYIRNGKRFRLSWVDMEWNLFPVNETPSSEPAEKAPMVEICASGDIGYVPATGHFHPNKPPGTSFFGVPGYFLLFHLESLAGIDPDNWWVLTLNAWLTTVCSVAVASALACVMFFRLARDLSGGASVPALLATFAFAFGTTFFPFATLFFDHSLTASLLVGALYFLYPRPGATIGRSSWAYLLGGGCAGFAAVTNYVAAVAGILLGLYALLASAPKRFHWRAALFYTIGVMGPFLLICWYGAECFGSPFKISNEFQNPLFKDTGGALLGMFAVPKTLDAVWRLGYVSSLLLISPFRGLFVLSPVLVMSLFGVCVWLRQRKNVAEAWLCLAIFSFFFLVNVTFNGYHGGFASGPRYLVPGLPFLALPLVVAFARWRKITSALALLSVSNQLLLTVTDAQSPVGVGGHARIEGRREEWDYNLLADYALPLFVTARAWPLLHAQLAMHMEKEERRIAAGEPDPVARKNQVQALREGLLGSINAGEPSPFLLGSVAGPVSVNPIGVYEGLFTYGFYPPQSPQCRWASFNVGEFFFPQSRLSILPLLGWLGVLASASLALAKSNAIEAGAESLKPDEAAKL